MTATWNDEDRLTYALQAEGPDEFPEGYYRAIARECITSGQIRALAERLEGQRARLSALASMWVEETYGGAATGKFTLDTAEHAAYVAAAKEAKETEHLLNRAKAKAAQTHLLGRHQCDHRCVCRLHEHPEPLLWSDKLREHACADSTCANGSGMGYDNPGGMPRRLDEHQLWWLVAGRGFRPRDAGRRLEMSRKRVAYLCEKWARQGRYTWGVSIDTGWAEDREPLPSP